MQLTAPELERRAPVWEALSELFAGKELQDYDYRHIAEVLKESGYPLVEIEAILRDEVAPVFHRNLRSLAVAEMEGWGRESVNTAVLAYIRARPSIATRLVRGWLQERQLAPIKKRWQAVQRFLVSGE